MTKETKFKDKKSAKQEAKFSKKATFTLSEVLIIIGVIGVVTALTIPTLMPLIKNKVIENRKEVIEDRLIQGFNQLNTLDDGFNAGQYSQTGTEGFVRALSKHYKMSQICGVNNLSDCFPYEYLNYTDKNSNKSIKVSELKNEKFGLDPANYLDLAAFINAQGTPFLISLNKNCVKDTGESIKAIPTDCVAIAYDNNGSTFPNKFGTDIISYGLKPNAAILDIVNGIKITSELQVFSPVKNSDYCNTNSAYYSLNLQCCGRPACSSSNPEEGDRWAGAAIECYRQGGRLPNYSELQKIASVIYKNGRLIKDNVPQSLSQIKSVTSDNSTHVWIWSRQNDGGHAAVGLKFSLTGTNRFDGASKLREFSVPSFCVTD